MKKSELKEMIKEEIQEAKAKEFEEPKEWEWTVKLECIKETASKFQKDLFKLVNKYNKIVSDSSVDSSHLI